MFWGIHDWDYFYSSCCHTFEEKYLTVIYDRNSSTVYEINEWMSKRMNELV